MLHKGKALQLPLRETMEVGLGGGRGGSSSHLSWLNGNVLL